MPPDASPSPVPPPTGLYGQPLKQHGNEMHEDLPDGGYIIWQIEKRRDGAEVWMPGDYIEAPKGKLS